MLAVHRDTDRHSPGALAATCPSSAGLPAPTHGDGGAAIVLHAAVPGRARLHVPRLYRDDAACDALVGALCDGKLMGSAHANRLTGNMLVLFDPSNVLVELVARVDAQARAIDTASLRMLGFDGGRGQRAAGTVSFMTLTLGRLLHAYRCRSSTHGTLNLVKRPRNRHLDLAIGGSVALQTLAGAIPGLNRLLGLSRIDVLDAAAVIARATVPYLIDESVKPRCLPRA
jgi:Cation transporting ATPase, C-terminus